MKRLTILAVLAAGAALVGPIGSAAAQTVCCADPGMRGYIPPPPPPQPAAYPYRDPTQQYGGPQDRGPEPDHRGGGGLRGYVGL